MKIRTTYSLKHCVDSKLEAILGTDISDNESLYIDKLSAFIWIHREGDLTVCYNSNVLNLDYKSIWYSSNTDKRFCTPPKGTVIVFTQGE